MAGYASLLAQRVLDDLEADPSYQELDPATQRNTRAKVLQDVYNADPQYASDPEVETVYRAGISRAPIIDGARFEPRAYAGPKPHPALIIEDTDALGYAAELVGGLRDEATREQAARDAAAYLEMSKSVENVFMLELATKGYDFLADMFGGKSRYFENAYSPRAKKAAQLIEDELNQYDPLRAKNAIATGSSIGAVNRFLESAGISIASAGAGAGTYAAKGVTSLVNQAGGSAARQALLGKIAEEAAEGLGYGAFQIARDLTRERLGTGQSLGTTWDERLGKIAMSFGTGVATDVATGLVLGVAKAAPLAVRRTYGRQPTGFDAVTKGIQDSETLDAARAFIETSFKGADVEGGLPSSLPPEVSKVLQMKSDIGRVIDSVKGPIDPYSAQGAVVNAAALGFHLAPKGKKYVLTSLVNPEVSRSFSGLDGAFRWAAGIYKLSDPPSVQATRAAVGAARADSIENVLKFETKGYARPEDLGEQEALKLLVPTTRGAVDGNNLSAYARWYLRKSGATEADVAGFRVEQGASWKTLEPDVNRVVMPKVVGSAADETAYLGKLDKKLEAYAESIGLAGKRGDVAAIEKLIAKPDLDTLSARSLGYVVKDKLGGELVRDASGVKLKFDDGVVLRYPNLNAANAAVFKNLVQAGSIDLPEATKLIKETYGYDLKVLPKEVGGVVGTQVGILGPKSKKYPHGVLIAKADTLGELFETRPDLVPKLPNRYAPELLFVDPELTTLQTTRAAAAGSMQTIRDLLKDFRSGWKPGTAYTTGPGGTLYLSNVSKRVLVVESPFGTRQKYIRPASAAKKIKQDVLNWDNLKAEAASRGFAVQAASDPAGGFLLYGGPERAFRARTLDEAAAFLKQQARPEDFPEVTGLGDSLVDELEDGYLDRIAQSGKYNVLERGDTWWENGVQYKKAKDGSITETLKGDFFWTNGGAWLSPVEAIFEGYAKRTGDPTFLRKFREIETTRDLVDVAIRKGGAVAKAVLGKSSGRLHSAKDLAFISELLSISEDRWVEFAKQTGRELKPEITRSALLTRKTFDELGKTFGVDASRWLREYVPKLEAVMKSGQYRPTLEGLKLAAKTEFGQIPKEVTFFTMNFRQGLVLDSLLGEKNAYNLLMAYITQGYKSMYMGPMWESLSTAVEDLKAAGTVIPPGLENRWHAYLDDVVGVLPPGLDTWHSQMSFALTSKIADIEEAALGKLSKLPVAGRLARDRLETGAARSVVSTDLLGKLGGRITLFTQGFRPWVALRNTLDLQRSGAVLGNQLVIDSFKEILDDPEYVGQLMRSGVIEDTLFSVTSAADIAQSRFRELATRGLISSDLLTRAATARAVDKAFDVGVKQLGAGRWDMPKFLRATGLDILAVDLKQGIADALVRGDVAGARFMAQKGMVDALMFSFRSGTGNLLTRGVVGKAFGKFQNYSFGMIDLYRKIFANSTGADKALRVAKMAGNAFAVYYAARALGIDYNGFLPQDSIGVSGGPYWRAAYAALDAGKEGARGSMARAELLRTFMVTAYPEPVARALTEGLDLASQGRDREAFLRMALGAPVDMDGR